ncbi:receptor-type tyrosine-protein phosphatase alpha-like [Neocloeon triangulifer]|uniref:receptor-type tyrosine-protein phosphatase alpha-like n=1 Tax=Neocloeon triangulifer TaxID=2078957 RepID=UPI00286F4C82|nr:receptor-type tyrosine-protein phosphatase alpha-like [Neocloeon triangulifer]
MDDSINNRSSSLLGNEPSLLGKEPSHFQKYPKIKQLAGGRDAFCDCQHDDMCNKPKNRLVHILPYEATRVCLQPIKGMEGSDYIKASFIDGYKYRAAYIATLIFPTPFEKTKTFPERRVRYIIRLGTSRRC